MKLNVSFPQTGSQKLFEVDDEKKLRIFYEKQMGHEVDVDTLGDEWKGYIVRISGGNDKQGFPMKQGVLTNNRVRLLLSKGQSCYRQRRTGERKRKSVRGCIVDSNLSVLALVVVKKGLAEIPGLTDKIVPRRLGPKRASNIRKLFNLDKNDDVRRYVIKRPITGKEGKKPKTKAPKIQRLITPSALLHRRHKLAIKRLRREKASEIKADYAKMLASRMKEAREKKKDEARRRRSSMRESKSSITSAPTTTAKDLLKKQAGAATAKAVARTSKKPSTAKTTGKSELAKPKPTGKAGSAKPKPTGGKTTSGKPTGGKTTSGKPTGGKTASGKPTGGKTASAKPTGGKTASAKPTGGKAAQTKATTGKAASTKPTGGKTAPTKATAGKAAPTKPAGGKAAPTKPAGGKAAPAKPAAGKAAPAKPAAGKAAPAKPAAGKAAPAKPAAGKAAPAEPKAKQAGSAKAPPKPKK